MIPEISLFELVNGVAPDGLSLSLGATTFRTLVQALLTLVRTAPEARLWVKLPKNQDWQVMLTDYQPERGRETLFLCRLTRETPYSQESALAATPLELSASGPLTQEWFAIATAPHLSWLILARPGASAEFEVICSHDKVAIETVLTALRQIVLNGGELAFPAAAPATAVAPLARLLHHQLQQTEMAIAAAHNSGETQACLTLIANTVQLKDEFLAELVQELRLPLTNMKTALRLLESKQLKREQRQRYLDLLYSECERQNSLIEGTLSLVELKVDAAAAMTPTHLDDLVPAIVSTFQPLAAEKGILLGYTIPPALPQVACPSSWLRQIILNLLNNSLKYTPPEGRVSVQATQIGDRIELTVKDTGIGIEASEVPKIFNNFYRGRAGYLENPGGAGLGLAIVHRLLQRCGGSIAVTSQVNRGSSFKVLLPIAPISLATNREA